MITISLLVPVCSRNQHYENFKDTPFMKYFFPSFLRTRSRKYRYTIYVGIDNTDIFYKKNAGEFMNCRKRGVSVQCVFLHNCEHKPAHAWNELCDLASRDATDYFYQIGDDIELKTPWAEEFIDILSTRDNIGVVGGCHDINYNGRIRAGKTPVIENAFVHKTHYHLFGTFFNREIENWYCDDWITEVYKPDYSTLCKDIKVENRVMDRYQIRDIGEKVKELIRRDKNILLQHHTLNLV